MPVEQMVLMEGFLPNHITAIFSHFPLASYITVGNLNTEDRMLISFPHFTSASLKRILKDKKGKQVHKKLKIVSSINSRIILYMVHKIINTISWVHVLLGPCVSKKKKKSKLMGKCDKKSYEKE